MQIVTEGIIPEIPEQNVHESPFPGENEQTKNLSPASIGIAVDVGTTTVVVSVWTLGKRKHLATVADKNEQIKYGCDIIRRISFAARPPLTGSATVVETGPSALHYCIICQLEKMFTKAVALTAQKLPRGFQPQVKQIVITGNTTMLSFVCALPVDDMAAAPFTPASLFDFSSSWKNVRSGKCSPQCTVLDPPTLEVIQSFDSSVIQDETPVYFPPCIGAFIGADTVCAMIAAGIPVPVPAPAQANENDEKSAAPLLLADIGTNSELCLYVPKTKERNARIICTAAASGPAFEAANISCGMPAIDGAIDSVSIASGKISCHVIGGINAKGLCGSGLVSAAAVLLKNNYIDENGAIIHGKSKLGDGSDCIELTPAVYLSQQDIRNLQLAKSAVKTGLEFLTSHIEDGKAPVFCIAGGFGTKMNLNDAKTIGLLPENLSENVVQLGNAALSGASALLFSSSLKEKARQIKKHSVQVNLAAVPDFQERFLNSIDFD